MKITDEDLAEYLEAASQKLTSAISECHVASLNLRAAGDDIHADAARALVKGLETLWREVENLSEKAQPKPKPKPLMGGFPD